MPGEIRKAREIIGFSQRRKAPDLYAAHFGEGDGFVQSFQRNGRDARGRRPGHFPVKIQIVQYIGRRPVQSSLDIRLGIVFRRNLDI